MSKVPGIGTWIKSSEIQQGSNAIILDEADWEKSTFQGKEIDQYVVTIKFNGEERRLKLTMASCKNIVSMGDDSKEWIGKRIGLKVVDVMVGGSIKKSILVFPFVESLNKESSSVESDDIAWDE